ncbi:MAG: polysaccharide export protein [Sphingopyxis sp.]|nr:polysaccharide export protein [Sphingopyxis sp.]
MLVVNPIRFLAVFAFSLLAACASGPTKVGGSPGITVVDATELPGPQGQMGEEQLHAYRIAPYDRLIVDVMAFEEFSDRKFDVDASGNISLPIAGAVQVGGLTPSQAAEQIASQLRRGFVRDPQVSINVEEAKSAYITVEGEVKKPGNHPIVDGMTLLRAVAVAEGATDFAQLRSVIVHRNVNGKAMVALYDLRSVRRGAYKDPVLYPRDIVVVGESANRRLTQVLLQLSPLLASPLIAILNNN